jgi:hypothetical protein
MATGGSSIMKTVKFWDEKDIIWVCDCQIPGKLSVVEQEAHDAIAHKLRELRPTNFPNRGISLAPRN